MVGIGGEDEGHVHKKSINVDRDWSRRDNSKKKLGFDTKGQTYYGFLSSRDFRECPWKTQDAQRTK